MRKLFSLFVCTLAAVSLSAQTVDKATVTSNADAAAKAAGVKIQSVERNRLGAGACVKMRGSISDVKYQ